MTSDIPASPPSAARHTSARTGVALVAAVLLTLAAPGAAQAHVRVLPDSTATGSFSALTFRVPNESATASTVKLTVQLPQDNPFLYVSSKPVAGWTVASTEAKLPKPVTSEGTTLTKAVRTVTWTADKAAAVGPGEYQEFSLSVGPLPAVGTVLLPATQTYSDGTVVRWNEPTPASGEEPEHPAPELVVTAAAAGGGADMGDESPAASASSAPASSAPPVSSADAATTTTRSDGVARGLGVGALVVALAGLGVALTGRQRRSAGR